MNKLMECKTCGKEIAKTAVSCPHSGGKIQKHPWRLDITFNKMVSYLILYLRRNISYYWNDYRRSYKMKVFTTKYNIPINKL